jgi:hypothetical protein
VSLTIAHVNYSLQVGGAEVLSAELCQPFREQGHRVDAHAEGLFAESFSTVAVKSRAERACSGGIAAAADAFDFSSSLEGQPIGLRVAMAARMPAVTSTAGAMQEVANGGARSSFVPVGSIDGFAAAIGWLAGGPALSSLIGQAVRHRFTPGQTTDRYLEFYRNGK